MRTTRVFTLRRSARPLAIIANNTTHLSNQRVIFVGALADRLAVTPNKCAGKNEHHITHRGRGRGRAGRKLNGGLRDSTLSNASRTICAQRRRCLSDEIFRIHERFLEGKSLCLAFVPVSHRSIGLLISRYRLGSCQISRELKTFDFPSPRFEISLRH